MHHSWAFCREGEGRVNVSWGEAFHICLDWASVWSRWVAWTSVAGNDSLGHEGRQEFSQAKWREEKRNLLCTWLPTLLALQGVCRLLFLSSQKCLVSPWVFHKTVRLMFPSLSCWFEGENSQLLPVLYISRLMESKTLRVDSRLDSDLRILKPVHLWFYCFLESTAWGVKYTISI